MACLWPWTHSQKMEQKYKRVCYVNQIWEAAVDEVFTSERELRNAEERYAVAIKKDRTIIGHLSEKGVVCLLCFAKENVPWLKNLRRAILQSNQLVLRWLFVVKFISCKKIFTTFHDCSSDIITPFLNHVHTKNKIDGCLSRNDPLQGSSCGNAQVKILKVL